MTSITRDEVCQYLKYNPSTGHVIWEKKTGDKVIPGRRAGWQRSKNGYRQIGFRGVIYYEHRLIWLMMTGRFPSHEVDHINGKKNDNRWGNLRSATRLQNVSNIGKKRDNTSGVKNVHWCSTKSRWIAKVKKNGKTHHVGTFTDIYVAARAARKARRQIFGEFARD